MNQNLIQQLNKLKSMEPDPVFAKNCRNLILNSRPIKTRPVLFNWPALVWVGGFALIFLAFLTNYFLFPHKQNLSSLDSSKLNQEFDNLDINIQLNEIKYQQKISQDIASALVEIGETNIKHLNRSLLENEQDKINFPDSDNSEINEMLNRVIF